MNDGSPTLEVGFAINFGDALGQLRSLDDIVGETAATVYREAQKMEKALGGGFGLSGTTAQITTFGNAVTRQMQELKRDTDRAEKSGEAMVRQMNKQIEVFGKSTSEIRQMRAEMRAAEADSRGLTELAGRIRAASKQLDSMEVSSGRLATTSNKNAFALKQVAIQLPDIIQGLLTGQKPMTVAIQQGGQIVQIAQMAQGGIRGFAKELGGLALRFAPFAIAIGIATAGFALFNHWINEGVKNDQLTRDLGKITGGANATKAELYKLREESITWGDTSKALFSVVGKDIAETFVGDMKTMSKGVKGVLDDLTSYGKSALAGLYAGLAGTRAYLGEIEKGGVTGLAKIAIGQGDPKLLEKTYGAAYEAADKYLTKLGARVKKAAIDNARDRIAKTVGYNNIPNPKTDKHAEQLARDAEATEAQIKNLYLLADAYGVSGAAALIAEARVKAESKAIRARADVEAAVAREVRLAVAQRVSDAAKGTATMREQASAQELVNAAVAAGNVPAELAGELLRDRIADLPLLAALQAAQKTGDIDGASRVEKALDDQRIARDRLTDSERQAARLAAMSGGSNSLAMLQEELRLVGATDAARGRALVTLRATQEAEAKGWGGQGAADYIAQQLAIFDAQQALTDAQNDYNDALNFTADLFDTIDQNAQRAAQGMSDAFGSVGSAIGNALTVLTGYYADQARLQEAHEAAIRRAGTSQAAIDRENRLFALRSSSAQIDAFGDMASAAKGFFKEGSSGYQALATAEKTFRAIQFALSIRAVAQDAIETGTKIANSVARTAAGAVEAVVNAIKSLPFPLNLAAGAATVAALASIGVSIAGSFGGGGKNTLAKANDGTGTVLGDTAAKSESIKRAIDALAEVDTTMLSYSREMAASLKSIDSQIGGVASLIVRAGNIDASGGVNTGFKSNATGTLAAIGGVIGGPIGAGIGALLTKIPVIGDLLSSLFGTKTSVLANGLYGGPQTVGSIVNNGFDAQYYSDIEKKKKFLGITTSTKYSTQYGAADAGLENQFTLILKSFNDAITAAAGPLGVATGDIQARLNSFVVNIGKIDLKGLTGEQIQEKLTAIFGAAADGMANAAFPGIAQFQKVGEGAFETLVRVASTVEAVGASLDLLGTKAQGMGIAVKLGLADQFDSVSALTSAADAYFQAFYSKEEQAAAKTAQFAKVFDSLGLSMPSTLAGFRQLVEAQDLTSAAGQATYATLLKLAPAFADLQAAMDGAKSAADIASERQDLQRQLLELQGNTAAIRALDLAKLDASNRALQEQIWAVQDAQEAAKAAADLASAWSSVGDSITDEIKRIRGLAETGTSGGFASILGQFNAANTAARGGDMDAAKSLPGLSQALLTAAALVATSPQELDRIQAQTAAALEATNAAIKGAKGATTIGTPTSATTASGYAILDAASLSQAATAPTAANDDTASELRALRAEMAQMRADNNAGHAATAGNTGRIARKFDDVTAASGGDAISVADAA